MNIASDSEDTSSKFSIRNGLSAVISKWPLKYRSKYKHGWTDLETCDRCWAHWIYSLDICRALPTYHEPITDWVTIYLELEKIFFITLKTKNNHIPFF